MLKSIFLLTISIFFCSEAFAQKRDTSVYYLKNSGKEVSSKDSADFFLVILPPDTDVDKNLFIVKEFYPSGKLRLLSCSKSSNLKKIEFQGPCVSFYSNGHKMLISNYEKGRVIGDEIEYYPNGKLYNIKSYTEDGKEFLKQCNDSTGNVLSENGNGKWINFYNESFKAFSEGHVNNGVEEGEWRGKWNDSINSILVYKTGKLISAKDFDMSGKDITKNTIQGEPEFPGGSDNMFKFINTNMKYPKTARKNGTQGEVIIGFVVEADGTLTNFKVIKGIGDGCDEEALRIMKIVPRWKNGVRNGKPAPINYSVPISFSLDNQTSKVITGDSAINKEFSPVEQVPEFPGGLEAFYIFLRKNIRPPAVARENDIQGKVIISYVVEKDGNLTNVKVVKGIGGGCEEEAVRVIKSSPPWKPGMLGGKIVRVTRSVSINFIFQGNLAWITVDPQ